MLKGRELILMWMWNLFVIPVIGVRNKFQTKKQKRRHFDELQIFQKQTLHLDQTLSLSKEMVWNYCVTTSRKKCCSKYSTHTHTPSILTPSRSLAKPYLLPSPLLLSHTHYLSLSHTHKHIWTQLVPYPVNARARATEIVPLSPQFLWNNEMEMFGKN